MLNYLFNYFTYEEKRKRLLNKAPDGVIKDFLSVPFPSPNTIIEQTPILAVDFETTGLNPKIDQILSVGYITIENDEILLSKSCHKIIRTTGELTEKNVIIHEITDDKKSQGELLHKVIEQLLKALAGKIMLVHFSKIENFFLQQACKQLYNFVPIFPIIDTLVIAKNRMDNFGIAYTPTELRLFNLCQWHKLPNYKAHNALNDALATAELFLAEIAIKNFKNSPKIKSLNIEY
jgi:DNA polymerase-3 subunit epsilon